MLRNEVVLSLLTLAFLINSSAFAGDEQAELAGLARKFHISISQAKTFPVKTSDKDITGKLPTGEHVRSFSKMLCSELSFYPPELLQRAGVWEIVLCEDLEYEHRRVALPEYHQHILFFDIDCDIYQDVYFRGAIHHEFYHMLDFADDGTFADKDWCLLNPPGFHYGAQGTSDELCTSPFAGRVRFDLPGFLNVYSTSAVEEDKAEIYSNLIVHGKQMDQFAARDPIIRAKIARLKAEFARFCPEITDAFWTAGRAIDRPSNWPTVVPQVVVPKTSEDLTNIRPNDARSRRVGTVLFEVACPVVVAGLCMIYQAKRRRQRTRRPGVAI